MSSKPKHRITVVINLPQLTNKSHSGFVKELKRLHSNQKTPMHHAPRILGREVNLLALYNAVVKRGGFRRVNTDCAWSEVLNEIGLSSNCGNAYHAVRCIYQRYLEPYERAHRASLASEVGCDVETVPASSSSSLIDDDSQNDSDLSLSSRRKGLRGPALGPEAVAMVYHSDLHDLPLHMREPWQLSTDLTEVVEFANLEKAVISGLPNEVDFALNALLLMSHQSGGLQLNRNPRLLNVLLASVGIFDCESDSFYHLNEDWKRQTGRNFLRYWYESVEEDEGRAYLRPDALSKGSIPDALDFINPNYLLFNLREDMMYSDREGHRVQLIATVLRNLVLDTHNRRLVSQSEQALRFLLLCSWASHVSLRQLGLETMAMLRYVVMGPLIDVFQSLLHRCLSSDDRMERIRGLQIMGNLCDDSNSNYYEDKSSLGSENTEFLASAVSDECYDCVIGSMALRDLHMVVLALDAAYGLSGLGEDVCQRLIGPHNHCMPTLITLLTLEAQAMGAESLIGVRVMQGPTGLAQGLSASALMPPPPVPQNSSSTPSKTGGSQGLSGSIPASNQQGKLPISAPKTPNRPSKVAIAPKPNDQLFSPVAVSVPVSTLVPQPPQRIIVSTSPAIVKQETKPVVLQPTTVQTINAIIKSEAQQDIIKPNIKKSPQIAISEKPVQISRLPSDTKDPEIPKDKLEFTIYWMKKNYEEYNQASVSRVQIYAQYQKAFQYQFKSTACLSALVFHNCIKETFPKVEQIKVQVPAGNVEIHYNNIKHLDDPAPSVSWPPSREGENPALVMPMITTVDISKSRTSVPAVNKLVPSINTEQLSAEEIPQSVDKKVAMTVSTIVNPSTNVQTTQLLEQKIAQQKVSLIGEELSRKRKSPPPSPELASSLSACASGPSSCVSSPSSSSCGFTGLNMSSKRPRTTLPNVTLVSQSQTVRTTAVVTPSTNIVATTTSTAPQTQLSLNQFNLCQIPFQLHSTTSTTAATPGAASQPVTTTPTSLAAQLQLTLQNSALAGQTHPALSSLESGGRATVVFVSADLAQTYQNSVDRRILYTTNSQEHLSSSHKEAESQTQQCSQSTSTSTANTGNSDSNIISAAAVRNRNAAALVTVPLQVQLGSHHILRMDNSNADANTRESLLQHVVTANNNNNSIIVSGPVSTAATQRSNYVDASLQTPQPEDRRDVALQQGKPLSKNHINGVVKMTSVANTTAPNVVGHQNGLPSDVKLKNEKSNDLESRVKYDESSTVNGGPHVFVNGKVQSLRNGVDTSDFTLECVTKKPATNELMSKVNGSSMIIQQHTDPSTKPNQVGSQPTSQLSIQNQHLQIVQQCIHAAQKQQAAESAISSSSTIGTPHQPALQSKAVHQAPVQSIQPSRPQTVISTTTTTPVNNPANTSQPIKVTLQPRQHPIPQMASTNKQLQPRPLGPVIPNTIKTTTTPGASSPARAPAKSKKAAASRAKVSKPAAPVSTVVMSTTTAPTSTPLGTLMCEWSACQRSFDSAEKVYSHVYSTHFLPLRSKQQEVCKWTGCDGHVKRAPISLLSHLHDRHCSMSALQTALVRRQHAAQQQQQLQYQVTQSASNVAASIVQNSVVKANPIIPSTISTSVQQQIQHSIQVHSNAGGQRVIATPVVHQSAPIQASHVNTTSSAVGSILVDSNASGGAVVSKEGPVTKHIRLTAALTLRNLAKNSHSARKYLVTHEAMLAEIAFSGLESSRSIWQCLSFMRSIASPSVKL